MTPFFPWLAEPTRYSRIQAELVLHLLAADFVDDATTVESLTAMRAELADMSAKVDSAAARAPEFPHRERYLLLNHALARRIVDAHADWLDDVEKTLGHE